METIIDQQMEVDDDEVDYVYEIIDDGLCEIEDCFEPEVMSIYGRRVCQAHWEMDCDGDVDLKEVFFEGSDTVNLTRAEAVSLMEAAGFKDAANFSAARLQKKVDKIFDVVDDGQTVEHPRWDEVSKALKAGEAVLVEAVEPAGTATETTVATTGGGAAPAEKAPKAAKEPKPKKAPPPKKSTQPGRTYCAGKVIRKYGLAATKNPTADHVKEVNDLCQRPNDKESMAWLKLAWTIIEGYTEVDRPAGTETAAAA